MLLTLIKGRYAAFFLSLQSINIVAGNTPYRYSTLIISYSTSPPGVRIVTTSSCSLPIRPRAIGEFTEMRFCLKISFIIAHDAVSLLFVVIRVQHANRGAKKITRPLFGILVISITCAFDSFASISLIRPSQKPCCSRAAWYSAFSFRSPCSRASAIAAIISGRRTDFRKSSSSRSFFLRHVRSSE